jgi:perosamine synthetase
MSELALLGGDSTVSEDPGDLFTWPIITKEDEDAVLEVLRGGGMSGTDITKEFETQFAAWQERTYALGFSSGTGSLQAAMFACGVGVGDEIISPSLTYWATALPVFSLGGTVVFADVEKDTLCIDPDDIEQKISPHTKAILVVHYLGHPADMDRIMAISKRHGIPVIEDVSHAHGGMYKGRKTGTFGAIAAMSLMSGKSLPVGEAGMLATDDRELYERALAFAHYGRFTADVQSDHLRQYAGLPLGGYKYRMHQMSSAVGRIQLSRYDERMAEIDTAMNYFCDCLEDIPGVRSHRVAPGEGSTMAGWYAARAWYEPEVLGGLSVSRFCEAVRAEGCDISPGANKPLHLHPLLTECDVYGHGKPTRLANARRDVIAADGKLPVTEWAGARLFAIPWFKKYRPNVIRRYADAIAKVSRHHEELLEGDLGNPPDVGGWHFFSHGG